MAKKRHIIRKSIKSFFERYTDPAKHDELKATRKEMEEKKLEILKLVQTQEQKDGSKTTSLSDLIEDFHKQYESLYDHYDHLTGELNNKHRHSASSSITESSDSDSDKSQKETTDGLQHELEESKLEVMLLENTLEVVCNKNDTLTRKLEDTESIVENLKVENEKLNSEKLGLKLEIEELIREKENDVRRLEEEENESRLKIRDLKQELTEKEENFMTAEKRYEEEIEELIREKGGLAMEKENALKRLEEVENDLRLKIADFLLEIRDLKQELTEKDENFMTAEKRYEEEIEELIREKYSLAIEKENALKRLEEEENESDLKIRDLKHELTEKEDNFMTTEKIYQDEINRLSANSAANRETITSISENVKSSVSGIEIICRNFEEDNEKFLRRMYRMSAEIQILRNCLAGKNAEREISEEKLRNLTEELQNERERGLSVNLLLKKKNEQAEILADEKREAIRQLCLWNDDVQSRYNELKSAVGKPSLQQRQSSFVKCISESN